MVEFTKENYLKLLTGDRYRFCQLNVPTFTSIHHNEKLIWEKILETQKIYSSYYRSNVYKFPEKIKSKLDKHFEFVKRCRKYWHKIYIGFSEFDQIEKRVIKYLFKPSSIRKKMRKIQRDIKKLFDKWNRCLKKFISTFDQYHLEDENRHVGKAIQSLCELLASGFY